MLSVKGFFTDENKVLIVDSFVVFCARIKCWCIIVSKTTTLAEVIAGVDSASSELNKTPLIKLLEF